MIPLATHTSPIYEEPSTRLSKSPIMNILAKTIATYMTLHNINHQNRQNQPRNNPQKWGVNKCF
jgi:hypothetical protein